MRLTSLLTLFCLALVLSGCGSQEERAAAHLETAHELLDEGDYVNARLEAQNAAQIEPKGAEARYLLALIAEHDGKIREMLQHLLVVVEVAPERIDARVKLGNLYVFGRVYDLAAEQAAAALALAQDDADVQVLNARVLLQQGDSLQGMAALDKALTLDPDQVDALGMKALASQENEPEQALALLDEAIGRIAGDESRSLRRLKLDILSRLGRSEEVEQTLLALVADAPEDDTTDQARLARFYRNQGKLDEAENVLRDLAAAASEEIDAKLNVVQFLAEVRAPETAIKTLQAFIEKDPENQQLKLALGDFYLNNDQRDKAVAIYKETAALDPLSETGLSARAKLAAERLRKGDKEGTSALVSAILTDAPTYPRALLMRAGLLFTGQRYDDAIADLRILLRKEPDNQRALLLMARSHTAAGDEVLGKDTYRRLLELNPGLDIASRELVGLMLQANETKEAEALLEQLAQDSADNMGVAIQKIELLVQQGDWQGAEAEARRIVAGADPRGIGAFQLGQVLEGQQRYQEATDAFYQALEKSPDNIQMMQGLARTLKARGKVDEMMAYLRERSAKNPDQPYIRLMLGGALAEQGQKTDALQILESVIDDQPDSSAAYIAVATLYPDDATKSIAAYRRGLDAVPGSLPLGASLADEYQRLGQTDNLIELYEALLAAHPENQEVANNLAATLADLRYQDSGSLKRAIQLADSLADTDDPSVMDTVGWVYYRAGENVRAIDYLERAAAALGQIPAVRYHLGMAYLAAGNRVGAKQELEKATQSAQANYPGIEEARKTLATLQGV